MGTKSLLMAMAALTIAGCSQNEVTEINPDADRTIGLDVYTGVQTRGTETTTSTLKEADAGFGIFAYKTSKEGWHSEKTSTTPDFMCYTNILKVAIFNFQTRQYIQIKQETLSLKTDFIKKLKV